MPAQSEKNRDEPDWVDRDKKRDKCQEEFFCKRLHMDRLSSHAESFFAKPAGYASNEPLGAKSFGRDAALRRPRTLSTLASRSADGAARRPYQRQAVRKPPFLV